MSTVIITVNGQFVSKNSKNAGSAGSANTTELKIVFDNEWLGFAKRIIWHDAKGENETSIILVPDVADNTSVYSTYVPQSVTKTAGWCSFTLEGYYESNPAKVIKSITDSLFVAYSQIKEEILSPTPDEAMQLQAEFEQLMPRVNALMTETKVGIEELADNLNVWESYRSTAMYKKGNKVGFNGRCYVCIKDVQGVSPVNEEFWLMIADRGEQGARGMQGPQGIRGEKGCKGEKGDKGDKGEKGDKGDRGINGSVVPANGFYSFNVDENGELWVNCPDSLNAPDIALNENGELIISIQGETVQKYNVGKVKGDKGDTGAQGEQGIQGEQGEKGDKGDTGDVGETGYTPVRGTDYWTEADKTEIVNEVLSALLNGDEVSY